MAEPVQFTPMKPQPLRGELRRDVPMSKHVSWRAGGPADRVYIPADLDDFAVFVRGLPAAEPLLVVGLGSNLLVREGGFRGTVVLLHGVLSSVSLLPAAADGAATRVRFEAGVACPKVARFAAMHGLEGAEFLAGIPGTRGLDRRVECQKVGLRGDLVDQLHDLTDTLRRLRQLPHRDGC